MRPRSQVRIQTPKRRGGPALVNSLAVSPTLSPHRRLSPASLLLRSHSHTTYDTSLTSAGAVVCSPRSFWISAPFATLRGRARGHGGRIPRGERSSVCSAQCGGRRLIFSLFSGAGRALDRPCSSSPFRCASFSSSSSFGRGNAMDGWDGLAGVRAELERRAALHLRLAARCRIAQGARLPLPR